MLDLARSDAPQALDSDPALTIIATRHPGVFRGQALTAPTGTRGELRLNPLYVRQDMGDLVHLRLSFPSTDYEDEYGACRQYLPEEVTMALASVRSLEAGERPAVLEDLIRRRVIIDLPKYYY